MAQLQQVNSEKIIPLLSYHVIGRLAEKVDLHINAFDVSRIHACIEYKDKVWTFYDQSSNGSLYNEELVSRSAKQLKLGDKIQFSSEETKVYEVINLDPPESFIISDDEKEVIFADKKFIELELDTGIYCVGDGQWVIEQGDSSRPLKNEGLVKNYKGKNWVFRVNEISGLTEIIQSHQKDVKLCLELSPDYEHVSLSLEVDNNSIQQPTKAMNFPLYYLAKQMQEDTLNDSYSDGEKGWMNSDRLVDILKKELSNPEIDMYYLNVQIYRLRNAFRKTPYGEILNGLIERRTGQIRLNHQNFSIKEYQD